MPPRFDKNRDATQIARDRSEGSNLLPENARTLNLGILCIPMSGHLNPMMALGGYEV
jgi:hypothetical protein